MFPRPKHEKASAGSAALQFGIKTSPFSFAVKRRDNGEVLFDTGTVPLVFEKQYVRLRTKLPDNPNLYGLGEHSDSFRFATDNYERVLLNAESPNLHRRLLRHVPVLDLWFPPVQVWILGRQHGR